MDRRYPRRGTRARSVAPLGIGETEARLLAGPLLLGIGIGLLAGQLLAGVLIGLGAGLTVRSVVGALRSKEARGRVS